MFEVGDIVKMPKIGNRVFKVSGFTTGESPAIPKGWLLDHDGIAVNPKFCEKYKGALSAIKHLDKGCKNV